MSQEGRVEQEAARAMRICVGSVLNRSLDRESHRVEYELYNPSIADYVFRAVRDWAAYRFYFAALRTDRCLNCMEQMWQSGIISRDAHDAILRGLGDVEVEHGRGVLDSYSVRLCEILVRHDEHRERYRGIIERVVNHIAYDQCNGCERAILVLMANALRYGFLECALPRVLALIDYLREWPFGFDELSLLSRLVSEFKGDGRAAIEKAACDCVKEYMAESVREYVYERELLTGVYDEEQYDSALEELSDEMSRALKRKGFSLDAQEIGEICQELDMDDIVDRNIKWSSYDYESPDSPAPIATELEDQRIDDLFQRDKR